MVRSLPLITLALLATFATDASNASACHRFCFTCQPCQPFYQPLACNFGLPNYSGTVVPAQPITADLTLDVHHLADVTQRVKSHQLAVGSTIGAKAAPTGAASPSFTCYQYTYYITGDSGFSPTTWSTFARNDAEATNFTNAHLAALGQQYHTSLHAQFRGKTGPFQCN